MTRPIRILYVIDTLHRGGTELQLSGLAARLATGGFEPTVATLRGFDPRVVPDGRRHVDLGVRSLVGPRGLSALRRLTAMIRSQRIDIVQTFFQDATLLGGLAARLGGAPVRLASFRDLGFWRARAYDLALRGVYRSMTGFIANSDSVRRHFCDHDGLDPRRVTVIPNGIDVGRIRFTPPRPEPRTVGIVGNLNRTVKRIDLFIEAAARLRDVHPEVRWEIVGDGHRRGEFEALAAARGLGGRIVFHGRLPDVPGVLAGWDVGILCSDSEGFSNALLEYMLAGCAPVATAVGGNVEAIDDGRTGLLVPPDDAGALAAAVGRLLDDGELVGRLAAQARQDAAARFSWDACVAAHAACYREHLRAVRPEVVQDR